MLGWSGAELGMLAAVTFLAYGVHAVIGFASQVVAVTLLGLHFDIPRVLPPLVVLSVAVNTWLVYAGRADVAWRVLARDVLPWMGTAAVVGFAVAGRLDGHALREGFGAFVAVVVGRDLWLQWRGTRPVVVRERPARAWLVVAGFVHGVFATGGPPLVLALSRTPLSKAELRATLCVVWVVLNLGLSAGFATRGTLDAAALGVAAVLAVPVALGVAAGTWVHDRVSPDGFRSATYLVLLASAVALVVR